MPTDLTGLLFCLSSGSKFVEGKPVDHKIFVGGDKLRPYAFLLLALRARRIYKSVGYFLHRKGYPSNRKEFPMRKINLYQPLSDYKR